MKLNLWKIILTLFFGIILSGLIWGAFRGIEFTDESVYLLQYKNPEFYPFLTASGYDNFMHKLTGWGEFSIYHFRLMNIFINLLGSLIISIGLYNFLKKHGMQYGLWTRKTVFLFIAIGNMVTLYTLPASIGYNSINNFLLISAFGCVLFYLSQKEKYGKFTWPIFTAGFLIGLNTLIKFPSSLLFGLVLCICFLLLKTRLNAYINLIAGGLAGLGVFFLFIQGAAEFWSEFHGALITGSGHSHNPLAIIKDYFVGVSLYLTLLCLEFIYSLFAFFIAILYKRALDRNGKKSFITPLMFAASYVILFLTFLNTKLYAPFNGYYGYHGLALGFIVLVVLQFMFCIFNEKLKLPHKEVIITCLILGLLPFIFAFGTNTPILIFTYIHIVGWFALVIVLNVVNSGYKPSYKALFIPLLVVLLSVSHLWFVFVKKPWRLSADLLAQNHTIENIPRANNIRVDMQTKQFIEELSLAFSEAGYKKGDYIFVFDHAGIVYLLEGISPGKITYYLPDIWGKDLNLTGFENMREVIYKTYFLLPKDCSREVCRLIEENRLLSEHTFVKEIINPLPKIHRDYSVSPLLLYKPPKQ